MSRPPFEDRTTAFFAELPPEFRELGEWLTGTLYRELAAKVVAIGLPRDLAETIAREAVHGVSRKILRGAQLYAVAHRAHDARRPPN